MSAAPKGSFAHSLSIQARVIGALVMRELHTRYGRENVGYLWMIGEPMLLATVIGTLHAAQPHTNYAGDIKPIPFVVLGYTIFILFRGVVNRSEGAIEANAPLLYHRMVTVLDITIARALLEFAGVFTTSAILFSLMISVGLAQPPVRPLVLLAAWFLMFWYAFAHSLIIGALSYENRTFGRLVHPYSYFMVGLSASFFQVGWLPQPYRTWLNWVPMTHIFELARHGQFRAANLAYFSAQYLVGACLILTWIGLLSVKMMRHKVHLS